MEREPDEMDIIISQIDCNKAVLISGFNGICRGCELTNLTVNNLRDDGKELRIRIYISKTKEWKEYFICGEFVKIVREYINFRPKHATSDRLFLQWRKGKCVNQNMGKNSIAKIPKEIATFLNLPNPSAYTGHSYHRTGATIAVEEGSSIDEIKRIGPWKSTRSNRSAVPVSVNVKTSPSDLTVASVGKTITISGLEKSQPIQTTGKENVTFHFSGECSNITIINVK